METAERLVAAEPEQVAPPPAAQPGPADQALVEQPPARSGDACEQYFKERDDGCVFSGGERRGGKSYLLCLTKKS